MPGPAPKPNARRRNVKPTSTQLPAAGYDGPTPAWPLGKASSAEKDAWEALWCTPQASEWVRLSATRTVARYVRALVVAEKRDTTAFHLSEVRQLEDRLGLTPMSMMRLRWEIAPAEVVDVGQDDDEAPLDNVRRLFA